MTEAVQINRRYFLEAEQIAKRLPSFFERRNLKPLFTNLFLFQDLGMTILIAVSMGLVVFIVMELANG